MRHRSGYELIVMAAFLCWLTSPAIAWPAEPPSHILGEIRAALEKNPDLEAWHHIYISLGIVPKLDSSAFRFEYAESFPDLHAHGFIMEVEDGFPDSTSAVFVRSPDRTHALFWSPMGGDIDSDASLVNLETREAVRVVQCGSSCIVELCAWLAPRQFVIALVWENQDESGLVGYHLRFLHFDLAAGIVSHFRGPTLKPGVDEERSRAWCQWLKQRFPQHREYFLGCL